MYSKEAGVACMKFINKARKTLVNVRMDLQRNENNEGSFICLTGEQRKRLRYADNNLAKAIKKLELIRKETDREY